MQRRVAVVSFSLLLTPVLVRAGPTPTNDAVGLLYSKNPDLYWDAKTAIVVDITCDGIPDSLLISYEPDSVWIGLVPGNLPGKTSKPIISHFDVGAGRRDSFCDVPVHAEIHPLVCSDDSGDLPGCIAVKGCSQFDVIDKKCAPFHFYWDSTRNLLAWWRH